MLEEALLDAAWEEVVETGYDGLTIEAVAERAQTSRAVIYRRWPTKPELVRAAVMHAVKQERIALPPDTGSLREDLLEVLRRTSRSRARLGIALFVQLGGYYSETGSSMADVRETLMAGGSALDTIFARAVERGEIDPAKLTPRVAGVPFDLYRAELLMTLKPVPDVVIESIVDEVFLPLVRPAG